MTMATDQKVDCRNNKVPLRKQSEIEDVEEQETSPGSDQSDATITTGRKKDFLYLVLYITQGALVAKYSK